MQPSFESLNKSLETSRLELLDMGLRGNTLLHCRPNAKSLEVFEEHADEVFHTLVVEQKSMSFIPIPEALLDDDSQANDLMDLSEIQAELYDDYPHTITRLQTRLSAIQLDKKLLKISTEAETYRQEQGVDILYLAFSFLTWFEDRNSDMPRKAPLVMVPVSLERSGAKERFKIVYTQADLGYNLTLAAKLKMEFQILLPEFHEDLDIGVYLDDVAERINDQPRWEINKDEIVLGFFSFGKFQMYQDLDPKNWPENKQPGKHSMIQALLGTGFGSSAKGETPPTPELTELHFVKDADSSQTEAVMSVKRGINLVIQGPPGTGKSQTITNIISESLADGKTVLFVAEKMAALEVVKRRLDECHLGDTVLELHSRKSNKRLVLEEIKRTLELGVPTVKDRSTEKRHYTQLSEQLDAYCHQVNQPILASEMCYINALGYHLKLKEEVGEHALPHLDFSTLRDWNKETFLEACALVRELVEHLVVMGAPAQNPFASSTLEEFSPIAQNHVVTQISKAQVLLQDCQVSAYALSEEMGLEVPENLIDIEVICRAAKRALDAPHLKGLKLTTDDWQLRRDHIKDLISAGSEMLELRTKRNEQIIGQAWEQDLLNTRQTWVTVGRRWWRFLSRDFRQAKSTLHGLMKSEMPKQTDDCIALIDDILKCQTLNDHFTSNERLGESLFGAQWQGKCSDWKVLQTLSNWVIEIYREVGEGVIPKGLLRFLEGGTELNSWGERLEKLSNTIEILKILITDLNAALSIQKAKNSGQNIEEQSLESLQSTFSIWSDQIDGLYQMTRYNCLRRKLRAHHLEQIDSLSYDWILPPELLLTALKKTWYEGLVNVAYNSSQSLKLFDRISHENIIKYFRKIDADLSHYAQEALILKHHESLPLSSAAGEMAIIRREMNKKRRHMPIRRLIAQAGRAIKHIKPVFMMSPISVATYLEQGALEFDLVIFDEASQVKVVDALGPILRGKQVVVVGDTRQMPPTDFFSKALELDDEEAEESQTADIESILNMFLSQGAPASMLRWHYRSRHESLITVSNQEFYDNRLMIFPSPGVNPNAKGLKFNYLPDAVYERGASRTNPIEARAVAEAVMVHAKMHPSLTLGVAAFSTAQRDCILLEVERLRRKDPSCEEFFNSSTLERFFVKNLENVQGDERDIIFISIGYGRTSAGNVVKNFGPVNREGGERRLNVLITRSRLAMEVFCNFTADDLETKSDSPFGVRALKSFLRYAETGELENRLETGKDTDSPFEDEVISAIRRFGYEIEPQLGSAGFYIDIAVKDPKKPGRYILAVECDGASYHSSTTARDRDRLRQSVLEGLGWRFHRIWSTDWFRNPYKEAERLKESIEQAQRFYLEFEANITVSSGEFVIADKELRRIKRSEPSERIGIKIDEYVIANKNLGIPYLAEIHELGLDQIGDALRKVVDVEGPIHVKEAAKRLAEAAGFSRVGGRMLGHIKKAVVYGQKNGTLHVDKRDFLFANGVKAVTVRDRTNLPAVSKKIELVSNQEIKEALVIALGAGFSLSEDEAISESLSMMGFQRSTSNAKNQVNIVLQELVQEKRVIFDNNRLSLC